MDTLQLPAYVVALGSIVSVVVSATKGGIEQVLPATNKWHDLAFTLYPLILTLALVVGYTATHGGDMFWSVVWGLLSGAFSIGAYTIHTRTGTPGGAEAEGGAAPRLPTDPSSPQRPAPLASAPTPGAPAPIDLSLPLSDPRQPAWAATLGQEAPPASAGTAQPAVATTSPPPAAADPAPQAPARVPSAPDAAWTSTTVRYEPPAAPVGPSVSDASGPPTP